ncbi:MAG: lysyl-tRNA synthetase, class [Solirubrobacteraceae bacterium]|nr:lysyl-tRNA synthetase, class [Solirubrobacteraceae bacterium]
MTLVAFERHALGPRVHVLGRRVHECHVGLVLAGAALLCLMAGGAEALATTLGTVSAWLLVKDWRDLHPTTRDTAAWSFGLHRRPDAPPAPSVRDRVPALSAVATATVGVVNIGSIMTGDLPARARAVLALAPAGEVRLAHALALPAGLALLGVAWPLARRRRRAMHLAVVLLAALGVLNLVKSLDWDVAVVSSALAALLWHNRAAFWVEHDRARLVGAVGRSAAVLGAVVLAGMGAVAVAASDALAPVPLSHVPGAALALLTLTGGPEFRAPFRWLPEALGILGAGTVAAVAANLLGPLRPRAVKDALERRRAAVLVRRHGNDTLSAFKLRSDLERCYTANGRAMAGYRIEAGAMLVAGDPVGPADAVPEVLDDVVALARRHGLALGVVGASREFADAARRVGLRRVYLGDEAILPGGPMDLSGGATKSLRKAVNRVARHGFTAELRTVGDLDAATVAELDGLSARWRDGAEERGFSMAHDTLVDDLLHDASVVIARDADGRIRAFLHFVPVYGRSAVSLAFMRRDRETPNGVSDFLVVEAARLLGEHGIEELSLNFAAFGRWLREPANGLERAAARVLRVADRWFQLERLMRFNAKFQPRWQPRYLLFAGVTQLPRVALGALWAEGHLPRPPRPRLRSERTAITAPR